MIIQNEIRLFGSGTLHKRRWLELLSYTGHIDELRSDTS